MSAVNLSSNSIPPSEDREKYQIVFRKQVFQLLKWAYDRLDAIQYRNAEEEAITGDLGEKIEEILQERSSPNWVGDYYVQVEKPINTPNRKGKKRQRLDIVIGIAVHGPRFSFPFEAKRLCANTHPIGAYLGPEGLGEFLAGNYAHKEMEAGMLGYVQSDTPTVWSNKARNKFRNNPDLVRACADGAWSDTVILANLGNCYRSKHYRKTVENPIILYHLFLVFH